MRQPASRRAIVLLSALMLAALTARLGLWQLDRAAQKEALQEAIAKQLAKPPLNAVNLARDAASAQDQLHRRVVLEGQWLAQYTLYLDNRQMNARPGFFALTPLQLDDGTAVLVQRGWLPRDLQDRARIDARPLPTARVLVNGRLTLEPSRLYEFDDAATGVIRQNASVAGVARETGLSLRPLTLVQLDVEETSGASREGTAAVDTSAADGLLRQWPAPASGIHKHYGYAFQWFALSSLTVGLYLWFQVLRPRRLKRPTLQTPTSGTTEP